MYYAVTLCCEKINNNISLFSNKNLIENVCSKIDLVYKEIKKNEKSPETDYLFNKVEKSNVEKTREKLSIMNNLDNIK